MGHVYDTAFFDYISAGSRESARIVIPLVRQLAPVASVLDVGCGQGAWLAEWVAQGVEDVAGLDGGYVDVSRLMFTAARFRPTDLSAPFRIGRCFDLVQCLEVAEHLPKASAIGLVQSLAGHGNVVLFSSATPGQGGEHHINERPVEYWRRLFAAEGLDAFDAIRPALQDEHEVMPWYRYNTLLYVRRGSALAATPQLAPWRIADDRRVPEMGGIGWRSRKFAVSLMPAPVREAVARLAARRGAARARRRIRAAEGGR